MNKLIIEKILDIDLNLMALSDGKHPTMHTISLMNLMGNRDALMTIDCDDDRSPRYKIDIHLECDEYTFCLDRKLEY